MMRYIALKFYKGYKWTVLLISLAHGFARIQARIQVKCSRVKGLLVLQILLFLLLFMIMVYYVFARIQARIQVKCLRVKGLLVL